MKLALVSTPRSGNTWLRYMLAHLYGLQQFAVHAPEDLAWDELPEDCIVQLHWHKTAAFTQLLADHGFKVVTIARHPIAVLLSIWHFAPHEPETARWLAGESGDERSIFNLSLAAPELLNYACGARAKALLSVSAEWWNEPGILRIRYEELVQQPVPTLSTLASEIKSVHGNIAETISKNTIDRLRPGATNEHFWRGEPYLWRTMLSRESIRQIQQAHAQVFATLGYAMTA